MASSDPVRRREIASKAAQAKNSAASARSLATYLPENLVYLCPNRHWEFDHGMTAVNGIIK